ncbi:hypothetical protein IFM47457_04129 [Aspergillus lentulus]|nr:hypothetical protein IFM47457_04129 [Aspergillus lentulus]
MSEHWQNMEKQKADKKEGHSMGFKGFIPPVQSRPVQTKLQTPDSNNNGRLPENVNAEWG